MVRERSGDDIVTVRMKLTGSRPWNNMTGQEPTGRAKTSCMNIPQSHVDCGEADQVGTETCTVEATGNVLPRSSWWGRGFSTNKPLQLSLGGYER